MPGPPLSLLKKEAAGLPTVLGCPMNKIEDRARAICEIGLLASGLSAGRELTDAVDRYWPVFAVELKAGVVNMTPRQSFADLEAALAACRSKIT